MPGSVLRLLVAPGDTVAAGQPMLAMEAMKMEHQVVAPLSGTVAEILVAVGQQLDTGQVLVRIDPADTEQADGS
jgi:propionyl-CoA carboxylase alpha chain